MASDVLNLLKSRNEQKIALKFFKSSGVGERMKKGHERRIQKESRKVRTQIDRNIHKEMRTSVCSVKEMRSQR